MSTFPVDSAGIVIGIPASNPALQSLALACAEWSMLRGTSFTAVEKNIEAPHKISLSSLPYKLGMGYF